jgi:hypothetical protein
MTGTREAEGSGGQGRRAVSWRLLAVVRAAEAPAARELVQVQVVTSGSLAAPLVPHDEEAAVRANLSQHASLVEGLHARMAVLPARYGTLVRRPEDVVATLLDRNRDALEQLLAEVSGRDEIRVRVYQVEQAALEEVVTNDPGVAELCAATRERPDGGAVGVRLALGERVATALARLAETDAALVVNTLRPFAAAVRGEAPASGSLILDASFLVDRTVAGAFDQAVGEVMKRLGARAEVRAVGPLPPYRFTELAVQGEEAA